LLDQAAISPGEFGVIEAAERVAAAGYAAAINSAEEKISMIGIRRVELDLAKQRRQDAVIAAPFDGLVQGRLVAPGGFIAAGDLVPRVTAGTLCDEIEGRPIAPF
jgi:multidrug resistance efflux pump